MNKEKLTELVYINVGRASMCWSEIPKGVFDSTRAAELGKEIMDAIEKYVEAQEESKEPGWNNPLVDFLDWEEKYKKSLKTLDAQQKERELIKKILADRSNAAGFDNFDPDRPRYYFEGRTYILNGKLDRIISMQVSSEEVERAWLMDDLREQDAAWERIKKNK